MNREQAAERLKGLAVPVSAEAAMDMAIEALEQEPYEDKVSLAVFKQVMRERDIAIEQLKELGHEFGEKIEPCTDAVSRKEVLDALNYAEIIDDDTGGRFLDEVATEELWDKLRNLPSVTPARRKAKWIQNKNKTWSCDRCHSWIPDEQHHYARYCLYCGADMEGEG